MSVDAVGNASSRGSRRRFSNGQTAEVHRRRQSRPRWNPRGGLRSPGKPSSYIRDRFDLRGALDIRGPFDIRDPFDIRGPCFQLFLSALAELRPGFVPGLVRRR